MEDDGIGSLESLAKSGGWGNRERIPAQSYRTRPEAQALASSFMHSGCEDVSPAERVADEGIALPGILGSVSNTK